MNSNQDNNNTDNKDKTRKRSLSDININNDTRIIKQKLSIEKLTLKKNNCIKQNSLALIDPNSLYSEDILLTDPNKCNCSYMAELYELYGQNIEKKIIICTHNNIKIVSP